MRILIELIPQEFIDLYQLQNKVSISFVYCENSQGMYGLSGAGVLATKLLKKRLKEHDYFEVKYTPDLFKHESRLTWLTLTIDDFGIKYIGKEHIEHQMLVLGKHYSTEEDRKGGMYCGIKLKRN